MVAVTGNTIILEGQHKYILILSFKNINFMTILTLENNAMLYMVSSADSFLQMSQRSWKFGMNTWNLVERLLTL